MGLGYNDLWVESLTWPQQKWGQRSSWVIDLLVKFLKNSHCIHLLWCITMGFGPTLQWMQKDVIAKAGETRGSRTRVGDFFDFFKKIKKIGFIWFKSDFFDLNQFFLFFLSNHPTLLEVNQSSSAQCLPVDNSNNAIKVKQIYIQVKETNEVKSWINCVEIRGKSSTLKWWNPG